jgi:hypothetical protein
MELNCEGNQLRLLNLTGLPSLAFLNCSHNLLETLDVTGLAKLADLICGDNQLRSLDFADLVNLVFLDCSNNQLTLLDVSNIALDSLSCAGNALVTLSLPAVPPTDIDADRVVLLVPDKANYADLSKFPAGTHTLLPSEYSVSAGAIADRNTLALGADIAGTARYQWQTLGVSDWVDVASADAAVYKTNLDSAADFYRLKFNFADDAEREYDFYTASLDIALAVPVSVFTEEPGLTDNPAPGNVTTVQAGTANVSWTFTVNPIYDLSTVELLGPLPSDVSLSLTRNANNGTVTVSGTVIHTVTPYAIDLKLSAQKADATGVTGAWYESPAYRVTVAEAFHYDEQDYHVGDLTALRGSIGIFSGYTN